ncbi:MAG: glycosyl hydrolase [Prolixibacteraceae bacterium]
MMNTCLSRTAWLGILILLFTVNGFALKPQKAVSRNALSETQALLDLFYSISGNYILTGQHNYPSTMDKNSKFAEKYIGEKPVIWSTDMGFAEDGDTDSYLARPDIVKEAIRQHKLGAIVTICWHAVPPTADEPITFRPLPGADPNNLASVQGQLLDAQYKALFTPGSALNVKWMAQMDTVAHYLKQLQVAKVPVLWRPYHEMNGDWFWWGGRTEGEYTTRRIYQTMFERYTNVHHLTNLVWVWSVDRVSRDGMEFEKFYPGNDMLDILALDVYGSDFAQKYYDGLMNLSNGKPLVLGEVGNPPTEQVMKEQPNWAYWVVWAGMVRNTNKKQYQEYIQNPRVLFQNDSAFLKEINAFRKKCQLIPIDPTSPFSGTWILNEDKSTASRGLGNAAYQLEILQLKDELMIERSSIVEWGEDQVSHDVYKASAEAIKTTNRWGGEQLSTVSWVNGTLLVKTVSAFNREGQSSEIWIISTNGKELILKQKSDSQWGKQESELVYDKK